MYTHVQNRHLSSTDLLRYCARTFAACLFAIWLGLVIAEMIRHGPPSSFDVLAQVSALAVVFVGYAVGWRNELFGGMLVILGTAGFFVGCWLMSGWLPTFESAWFALPGVLFLLAWLQERRCHAS